MARIAVFNQKGGVGKTTRTPKLAGLLNYRDDDPLVIDLDPQAHLTAAWWCRERWSVSTVFMRMAVDIERQLRERYGDEVCATHIAEKVSPAESPAGNQDVFDHAPASRGAQHYTELLEELVVAGFMHAARTKTRPVTRNVPPGARTALTSEQQSAVQSQVAAGLKLVHALQTGS
ncbi:MAG: AAA family ATPase [Burkholderiales bacterium]